MQSHYMPPIHTLWYKKSRIASFVPKFNVKVSRLAILCEAPKPTNVVCYSPVLLNCDIDLTDQYGSEARPFSHLGCADGRTSGYWEDSPSQGRSHRVWDHILQCLLLHPHLQVSWRVRETYQDTLWNGAYDLCACSFKVPPFISISSFHRLPPLIPLSPSITFLFPPPSLF